MKTLRNHERCSHKFTRDLFCGLLATLTVPILYSSVKCGRIHVNLEHYLVYRKSKHLLAEKKFQRHFVYHKSYTDWPDIIWIKIQ
jgi:hypothetical protein